MKWHLSHYERCPFITQKTTFYNVKGGLLQSCMFQGIPQVAAAYASFCLVPMRASTTLIT